jgi:GNAT superfamily N-acetyltransferase
MVESIQIHVGGPGAAELSAVNAVVEGAVMGCRLPERVKRLALPVYRYDDADRNHLGFAIARDARGLVVGVAAWEPADSGDCPPGRRGLLLHGLYVEPARQRRGIGRRLLDQARRAADDAGLDGLLVRAQRDAEAFFLAYGFEKLPAEEGRQQYAHRLWRPARNGSA